MSKRESNVVERDDAAAPEGMAFIKLLVDQERACEEETSAIQATLGEQGPKCLAAMGTVLSLIDRLASCWWGCAKGDHVVEFLAGRCVASARGSLRLCLHGYYDEALGLTRSIGEIANLLALFAADTTALATWKSATRRERRNDFGPAPVRRRLHALGAPQPISEERYAILCELATHATPHTRPQAHNPMGLAHMGARFQVAGYLLALNELAVPVAFVGLFASTLLKLERPLRERFAVAGRALAEAIGGINLIDGYPVLEGKTISELENLIAQAPVGDQQYLRQAILRMAEGLPIVPTAGREQPEKGK